MGWIFYSLLLFDYIMSIHWRDHSLISCVCTIKSNGIQFIIYYIYSNQTSLFISILTFGEGRFKVNIYLFVETLFCDVALTILQATKAVVFYKC